MKTEPNPTLRLIWQILIMGMASAVFVGAPIRENPRHVLQPFPPQQRLHLIQLYAKQITPHNVFDTLRENCRTELWRRSDLEYAKLPYPSCERLLAKYAGVCLPETLLYFERLTLLHYAARRDMPVLAEKLLPILYRLAQTCTAN